MINIPNIRNPGSANNYSPCAAWVQIYITNG